MSIYTSYRTSAYKKTAPENKKLSSIINDIKSGKYAKKVKQIQNEKNYEKQTKLKKKLPLFKSCLNAENTPNGLVHFDVDTKDNPDADFTKLKQNILKIPEVIYCFYSPKKGLKFALLTDFKVNAGDGEQSRKERFKQAYFKSKEHVENHIESIVFDDVMSSIVQDCYVSHDEDAYCNESCNVLKINDDCVYIEPDYSRLMTDNAIPESQIIELLSYIPHNLKYKKRLPVNYAVLYELGEAGIYLLMGHWITDDRTKLESGLKSQLKNCKFGNIGTLIKIARKHGYTFTKEPKKSNHKFPALLTIDEADIQLKNAIHNFFDNRVSTFLNVSTGFGKTTDTLDILRQIPKGKRALILVQSHEFASELIDKYRSIQKENTDTSLAPFQRMLNPNKTICGITHIKGKVLLCKNSEILGKYKDAGLGIPHNECKYCPKYHVSGCKYIEQFNSIDNIRVMTHDAYMNEKPAWERGNSGFDGSLPNNRNWNPNYIIIDENFLKSDDCVANLDSEFSSIRNIINDVLNGSSLEDATANNYDDLFLDYDGSKEVKFSAGGDIDNIKSYNKTKKEQEILQGLLDGDFNRFKLIQTEKSTKLYYFKMKQIHSRYNNVPALYLDATANETVVKTLLPNVKSVDLKVKQSDEIDVFMASDFNIIKGWFNTAGNLKRLTKMLKARVAENKNIGFITYKNIDGVKNFDYKLAKETGIKIRNHFGNLRGSNQFENVEELYIIGRQFLKMHEYTNLASAIFNCDVQLPLSKKGKVIYPQEWIETPVRMKDGSSMSLMNKKFLQNELELVKSHFGDSETIQAIGRGRLIHGCKKKVYLLSDEVLEGIEITDFIKEDDILPKIKYSDQIRKAVTQGYCKNKRGELIDLGFSEHHFKVNKNKIDREFKEAGFKLHDFEVKKKNRVTTTWEYYVLDEDKMDLHLDSIGATLI